MFDVVTLGEALVLLAASQPGPLAQVKTFTKHTAGAETNVAVGLARLGLRVAWVSSLGQDSLGEYLLQAFVQEGIDCSQVPRVAGQRTAWMFKGRVDDGGDPPIEYHRQGSAASRLQPFDLDAAVFQSARHLHLSGVFSGVSEMAYAAQQRAISLMREHRKTVSFDTNLRPAMWPSERLMRERIQALAVQADWVLPGLHEGQLLTGCSQPQDIAAVYRRAGASHVVVKLGAQGAYFDTEQGQGWVPAFDVPRVVDTVGAGDAFAAGVISGLLEGLSLQEATRRAAWMGARAVQASGDSEGLPTRVELDAANL
jgi:sugar/nucleoside kinase (ribokinase family)